jgi:hypothetical protein
MKHANEARASPVVLTVDIENDVLYRGDVSDVSALAKNPRPTTSVNHAFLESVAIADIVAVNGDAVRGMRLYHVRALPLRANPTPGQPIADVDGTGIFPLHLAYPGAGRTLAGQHHGPRR